MIIINPFAGDIFILEEFRKIVKKFGIKNIVETGTCLGSSAMAFSLMVDNVVTIELNRETYLKAKFLNIFSNIKRFCGDSPSIMSHEIPKLVGPTAFFLDAHWYEDLPLLKELEAIARSGIKDCVILIHDFAVPNKSFEYYTHNGQDLNWEYVEKHIIDIYGPDGFTYYYNENPHPANRGIVYILPNK